MCIIYGILYVYIMYIIVIKLCLLCLYIYIYIYIIKYIIYVNIHITNRRIIQQKSSFIW